MCICVSYMCVVPVQVWLWLDLWCLRVRIHIVIRHLERAGKGLWVICELLFDWWANQSRTKDFINNRHPATNQQSSTHTCTYQDLSAYTHAFHKHTDGNVSTAASASADPTHLSKNTLSPLGMCVCVFDISNFVITKSAVILWPFHQDCLRVTRILMGHSCTLGKHQHRLNQKTNECWLFPFTFGLFHNHGGFDKQWGCSTVARKKKRKTETQPAELLFYIK